MVVTRLVLAEFEVKPQLKPATVKRNSLDALSSGFGRTRIWSRPESGLLCLTYAAFAQRFQAKHLKTFEVF